MNAIELLDIISTGETSTVQFKREITHNDSIAAEIVAMSNSLGGKIFIGIVDKTGEIYGIDIQGNLNERVANIATNNINPPVYITTEIISIENGDKAKVLVVNIPKGINKPYKDNNGSIWVKQGSDKRRVTDNAEIMRMFQSSGTLFIDEMIVPGTSVEDIDVSKVRSYLIKIDEQAEIEPILFNNLSILKDGRLTIAGLLFFSKDPQKYRPAFCIKAVSFFGNDLGGSEYRNSRDIVGTIPEMFNQSIEFFASNLFHLQGDQNFNSVGKLEISKIALEELLQNAILHRDYSKNAPIRILIFDNRIEIISPGKLYNSLTIANIKMGHTAFRNNKLVSYGSKLMNYRGIGSGIRRALKNQPNIEFINQVEGEQFIVKIPRPEKV